MAYLVYPNEMQTHVEGSYAARQMALHENSMSRMSHAHDHMTSNGSQYTYPTAGLQETSGYGLPMSKPTETLKAPAPLGQHYFVDRMMNPHPYSSIYPGLDMNAIRRKNASRETTGPLKTWLREHRKNPYPTKGEKVMLAIGTRMTLTQVSTWFANARRRMKKDRNDDDDDDDKADISVPDVNATRSERSDSICSRLSQSSGSEADTSKDLSDTSDIDDTSFRGRQSRKCVQRLFSPETETRDGHMFSSSSPESLYHDSGSSQGGLLRIAERLDESEHIDVLNDEDIAPTFTSDKCSVSQKPKIWSISEIIGTDNSSVQSVKSEFPDNMYTFSETSSANYFSNALPSFSQYFSSYAAQL